MSERAFLYKTSPSCHRNMENFVCVCVCAHVLVFHVPVNGSPRWSTPWSNLLRSLTASFSSRHGVWLDALTWLGTFRVAKTHTTSFIIPLLLRLCNLIKLFITFQLTPFPRVSVTLLFAEDKCIMGWPTARKLSINICS